MKTFIKRQNFISADQETARDSYGNYFSIGEIVTHDDVNAGSATILSFEPDINQNEIRVNTSKGYAYIDFISKI